MRKSIRKKKKDWSTTGFQIHFQDKIEVKIKKEKQKIERRDSISTSSLETPFLKLWMPSAQKWA